MKHGCHPGLYARDPSYRHLEYVSHALAAPAKRSDGFTARFTMDPGDKPRDDASGEGGALGREAAR